MDATQIIILAAGRGTRMQSELPKALTLFRGRPFLTHVLDTISQLPLHIEPIVVVGYKHEQVRALMGDTLRYALQSEMLGTGHAVASSRDESAKHPHATTFISYADQPLLTAKTIESLILRQQQTKAKLVLGTTTVPDFNEWRSGFERFGRIVRDDTGNVTGIIEYKDATQQQRDILEVNPAYFAFDADWMWSHLAQLSNNNAAGEYYLTDLITMAFAQGHTIHTVPIDPYEALGANSLDDLAVMESAASEK